MAVNAGTLTFGTGSSVANTAGTFQVSKGAVLDVTLLGLTLTGGQTLQRPVPSPAVTVGSGGTVRPSALGGASANGASPGTLGVGDAVFAPGGTYEWYLNSAQGGAYTQSALNGTGNFDLSRAFRQ